MPLRSSIVAVCVLTLLVGCGGEREQETKPLIDDANASYQGIGLGKSRREVVAEFGEPTVKSGPVVPTDAEPGELSTVASWDCGRRGLGRSENLRYDVVLFSLEGGEVCSWIAIESGVATSRGVAIGDHLDDAREAYPDLTCGEAQNGEDILNRPSTEPFCTGPLGSHGFVWFGGDPIDVIQAHIRPFQR
jgi:hypothetical protein